EDVFIRKTTNYRVWIDETGIGRIRILKRINFKTLASLFEELHGEIKKRINERKVHIVFYISKSLYEEMSVNAKDFLGFCQSCMGITFEIVLIGL
ncbi:MAG: hypothetical protein QSU88_11235, partial [Candidatus Methanoperedens sp.]|nr:hypothetical protein [Candidatus Methanoperedens sp.]